MSCKYIIIFEARSGSTYTAELLNSHPDIICWDECLAGQNEHQQHQTIEKLFSRNQPDVLGFTTKLTDVANKDRLANVIQDQNIHIICLYRKNIVKTVISWINAQRLHDTYGIYNQKRDSRVDLPPLHVDLDEFARKLQKREKLNQDLLDYMAQFTTPRLVIYYEDLLSEHDEYVQRLLSFLNVEASEMTSDFVKTTSNNLEDALANFIELKNAYKDTDYEVMFSSDDIQDPPMSPGAKTGL